MASAFDRVSDFALVFGAVAGLSARADFSVFVYKLTQQIDILVVDDDAFICAKAAVPGAEKSPLPPLSSELAHVSYSYFFYMEVLIRSRLEGEFILNGFLIGNFLV